MKTMWRGAISFGLINIGVRLYTATVDHDFRFHQVHRADHGRVRYQRRCEVCGRDVDYDDIAKGYQRADGELVVLDSEDFRTLPIRTDHAIELLECVPSEQVDPIYFQKSYYVAPEKSSLRPYVLLREALERTNRLAVVKITLRQRETLAVIRSRDDVLVLHTMLWPDEVRSPDFEVLRSDADLRSQEIDMATSLVENMSEDFDATEFTDDYQRALDELLEAKSQGAAPPEKPPPPADEGEVVDLTAALKRSVHQAKDTKQKTRDSRQARRRSHSHGSKGKTTPGHSSSRGRKTGTRGSGGR